ncbi:MAG: HPr family phosphocarrier protein [Rhodoluna sp.]
MISSGKVTVTAPEGLHARPAADFVRAVGLSAHQVKITNQEGRSADGSSILAVLSLGVKQGQSLEIEVTGDDSAKVLSALIAVVSRAKQG